MQPPSIRTTRGLRFALGSTLIAVLAGLMFVAPANAAPPPPDAKVVTAGDSNVKLQCRFTTTSANYAAGTVRGRLTTKISWAGQAGFKNVAEVNVQCILGDLATFTDITQIGTPTIQGRAAYVSKIITVPLSTGYYVCVQGFYRLKNGIPNNISTSCAI